VASNVFEAITAVMADVAYVKKDGRMTAGPQRYNFVQAEDIVAALRPSMVQHGLCMFPTRIDKVLDETYETQRGGKMNRVVLSVQYVLSHGPSNTNCVVAAIGEAADSGDKACNKAMTAANKYALRQAFQIETGDDDPDKHASADQERAALPAKNGNAASGLTSAERFDVAKVKIRAANEPTEIDKLMAYASRLNKDGVFDDRQLKLLELECNIRRTSLEQMASAPPM
jgi:hypothetical protein